MAPFDRFAQRLSGLSRSVGLAAAVTALVVTVGGVGALLANPEAVMRHALASTPEVDTPTTYARSRGAAGSAAPSSEGLDPGATLWPAATGERVTGPAGRGLVGGLAAGDRLSIATADGSKRTLQVISVRPATLGQLTAASDDPATLPTTFLLVTAQPIDDSGRRLAERPVRFMIEADTAVVARPTLTPRAAPAGSL